MADKLTAKQKKFADEYIKTGNAELAAKTAGYNARGNTTKLLRNTTIAEYIKKRAEAQRIAEDEAIAKAINRGAIADMVEVKEFWTATLRDGNIKPQDRLKASELIAKTNGAFIDKIESTNHNLNQDITNMTEEEVDAELKKYGVKV